jgi:hypothetical protein
MGIILKATLQARRRHSISLFIPVFPFARTLISVSVSFPALCVHQAPVNLVTNPGALPGRFLFANPFAVLLISIEFGCASSGFCIISGAACHKSH